MVIKIQCLISTILLYYVIRIYQNLNLFNLDQNQNYDGSVRN
jgi:hypothetical protein